MQPNNKKPSLKKLILPLALIVLALLVYFSIDFFDLADRFSALGYEPTPAVVALESSISLTDKGSLIFAASRPELSDRDSFNKNCRKDDLEISILGCFTDSHIFIYNVDSPELAGIEESTLAHELLHAVWARLSDQEKSKLTPALDEAYGNNKATLDAELVHYDSSLIHDELHSRLGTEFRDLPDALESHYQKYFSDRAKIVSFFEAYNGEFKALKAAADSLLAEIDTLRSEIDTKTSAYYTAIDSLNASIADFNNRANSGYFTSSAAFERERATLVAETNRLSGAYAEIDSLVARANTLIEEYNNNLARAEDLNNAINSNLTPAPTL